MNYILEDFKRFSSARQKQAMAKMRERINYANEMLIKTTSLKAFQKWERERQHCNDTWAAMWNIWSKNNATATFGA